MEYGNKLTKEQIIEKAIVETQKGTYGFYINTDNIATDLDGKYMAEYLTSIGFHVIKYYDTGNNGLVITKEGVNVSTNGFCSVLVIENISKLSFDEIQKIVEKQLNEEIHIIRDYCYSEDGGVIQYCKTEDLYSIDYIKFNLKVC